MKESQFSSSSTSKLERNYFSFSLLKKENSLYHYILLRKGDAWCLVLMKLPRKGMASPESALGPIFLSTQATEAPCPGPNPVTMPWESCPHPHAFPLYLQQLKREETVIQSS